MRECPPPPNDARQRRRASREPWEPEQRIRAFYSSLTKALELFAAADPATDPTFPSPGAVTLATVGHAVEVKVQTMTPNFRTFMARFDGGEWKPVGDTFKWTPHRGKTRLEVKAVNRFNVDGHVSIIEPGDHV